MLRVVTDAKLISAEQRDPASYEELVGMPEREARLVLWERATGSWGLLRPRFDRLEDESPKVHPGGGSPA